MLIQIDEFREFDRRCVFFEFAVRLCRRSVRFDRCRRFVNVLLNVFKSFVYFFLNFAFIDFFTINVDSNMIRRRSSDSCKFESIMFTILSRNKVCISFFIWAFRLNKNKSAHTFYVLATSSRPLFNDDITSIFTDYYAFDMILKTRLYKCLQSV